MKTDKNNVKAILIKAESLFNCCQFEHALLLFHRGQKLAPEDDEFRLGIQKCHKTIKDSVRDERVFKREGKKSVVQINPLAIYIYNKLIQGRPKSEIERINARIRSIDRLLRRKEAKLRKLRD